MSTNETRKEWKQSRVNIFNKIGNKLNVIENEKVTKILLYEQIFLRSKK